MFLTSPQRSLSRRARTLLAASLLIATAGLSLAEAGPANWWKPEWSARKKITIHTGADGVPIDSPPGSPALLVRLSGDFAFASAKEDGSDLRFLAADNKTVLPHHIERWDSLLNEGIVWVKVTDLKPGASNEIFLYYGNPAAELANNPKGTYDDDTLGVYHFSGGNNDSSAIGVAAEGTAVPVTTALMAGGVRFTGQNSLKILTNPATAWTANGALTLSVWVKPATLGPNAVIYSRRDAAGTFVLGLNNGVPYLTIGTATSPAAAPVTVAAWSHLAVTVDAGKATLYLNGTSYATLAAPLPGLAGDASVGKDMAPGPAEAGFAGELDELILSKTARTPGAIKFAAISQGGTAEATKLTTAGEAEAGKPVEHDVIGEHLDLIKQISQSLDIFGWIVIYLCAFLALIAAIVAIGKLVYLIKIDKASKVFLKQWENISTDITALDHSDADSVKSMGGNSSNKEQRAMKESPLFNLYHIGSQEIQHRVDAAKGNFAGLSERSIGAIRAMLDGGATRETQKLQSKLVFLTIGIAGGPYLGLFGTVIGVMITFAVIAKSGEVDINSIAPGIAGALLATLAGLAVAIPALFAYSYLASRIKDATLSMHTFIEEFIARIAEAYPTKD
jgi:biopolymer transport protein ExbB